MDGHNDCAMAEPMKAGTQWRGIVPFTFGYTGRLADPKEYQQYTTTILYSYR